MARMRLVRALLALALCATPVAAADLETSLYLIGDAGAPDLRAEPVLSALRTDLSRDPARSFAVFLGDNIYPRGLPAPGAPARAEAERRIDAELEAARGAGLRTLFVPGNHDWDRHGADGWNAIQRQARYVEAKGALFLPQGGLPGPAIQDVGEHLRLVVLDTQWWLHNGPKPPAPQKEVLAALHAAVADAGDRRVVVLSHHPPASGGVQMQTSRTPATIAGIAFISTLEGYAPRPPGT